MIIVSSEALARHDGESIRQLVNKIGEQSNVINAKEKWNGINVLHTEATRVGALDIGIKP
jgi:NADH-quinone oxidoreductase subunit G